MKNNKIFRITLAAVLCAQALALSALENLLPAFPFMPPGAKPGFSNIITMFAAGSLGLPWALVITVIKGGFAFVTRGFTAAAMSLSGGILSTVVMYLLLRYADKYIGLIGISVVSALCHNAGQLLTSVAITGSAKTFYYAPALALFGLATGVVTGFIFRAVLPALEKQKQFFFKSDIN